MAGTTSQPWHVMRVWEHYMLSVAYMLIDRVVEDYMQSAPKMDHINRFVTMVINDDTYKYNKFLNHGWKKFN